MCVFFIFFTPVESNSKCISPPPSPLFTPQIPLKASSKSFGKE